MIFIEYDALVNVVFPPLVVMLIINLIIVNTPAIKLKTKSN